MLNTTITTIKLFNIPQIKGTYKPPIQIIESVSAPISTILFWREILTPQSVWFVMNSMVGCIFCLAFIKSCLLISESILWNEQEKHPNQSWSMNSVFCSQFYPSLHFIKKCSLNEHVSSESHWPETPGEYSLQFMWPNSVKCVLFHPCVSTKHVCLLDPANKYWTKFSKNLNLLA